MAQNLLIVQDGIRASETASASSTRIREASERSSFSASLSAASRSLRGIRSSKRSRSPIGSLGRGRGFGRARGGPFRFCFLAIRPLREAQFSAVAAPAFALNRSCGCVKRTDKTIVGCSVASLVGRSHQGEKLGHSSSLVLAGRQPVRRVPRVQRADPVRGTAGSAVHLAGIKAPQLPLCPTLSNREILGQPHTLNIRYGYGTVKRNPGKFRG